ncbi:hypothetical protein CSUB01_12459 [Colletotrichum sublineola]|uniref:Uncharacterized protein n=1 Tax=Colletotrichum sublineola TaxID=1173701 RepID=A0A066WZM6_COLSU|nr:hypothetical protein CSUB01_12459 [Colletotrichum sublineola]
MHKRPSQALTAAIGPHGLRPPPEAGLAWWCAVDTCVGPYELEGPQDGHEPFGRVCLLPGAKSGSGSESGSRSHTYGKRAKDKVRKSGSSAKRKAIQLGKEAGVFSAVVYFNPTYGCLEGAVHVPDGQVIPDVNRFLEELRNSVQSIVQTYSPQQAPTRHGLLHGETAAETGGTDIDANAEEKMDADTDPYHSIAVNCSGADWTDNPKANHDGTLAAARDSGNETQHSRGMGIDYYETPDGAVDDGVSGHDTSICMFDVGGQDVFEMEGAGNQVHAGPSQDVSDCPGAQNTRAVRGGSARSQARVVQRFLRQVSLRMRLAARQDGLLLHQIAHRDRLPRRVL